jgi:hypothetical protein
LELRDYIRLRSQEPWPIFPGRQGQKGVWILGSLDPWNRISAQDGGVYIMAAVAGLSAFLTDWAIIGATVLLVGASAWDYFLGVSLARIEDARAEISEYDPHLARIGRTLKLNALVQVWILWGLELLVSAANPWDLSTHGYVAVSAAVVLVIDELDSLDRNRVRYGQRPLFGWRSYKDRILNALGKDTDPSPSGGGGGNGENQY